MAIFCHDMRMHKSVVLWFILRALVRARVCHDYADDDDDVQGRCWTTERTIIARFGVLAGLGSQLCECVLYKHAQNKQINTSRTDA